jgi:hypothetical protein
MTQKQREPGFESRFFLLTVGEIKLKRSLQNATKKCQYYFTQLELSSSSIVIFGINLTVWIHKKGFAYSSKPRDCN